MGKTLSDKVWDAHVVRSAPGEPDLLYIDLHLVHEVTSPQAFDGLRLAGRAVRRTDHTMATEDHNTPTLNILAPIADPVSRLQVDTLRKNADEFGIRRHSLGDKDQGVVHIIGPQLGLTQPGLTVVCGDSHTSTHGAFGALAFGIGTSEVEHVLATQTLPQPRPKTMAININGTLAEGVTPKDVVLALIAKVGTGGGQGYVVEYRGNVMREMSMEGRMTICNMSIEWGAKAGMVAPDETTFAYLKGRPHAPEGADWDAAVEYWRTLYTDDDAVFDVEVELDADRLTPFVTWGTNPGQGVPLAATVPAPEQFDDPVEKAAAERALEYMALHAGTPMRDIRGGHGIPRLVHQRPDRGPPAGRVGDPGTPGGRRRPDAGGARFRPGAAAGDGRGPRSGLQGRRRRVARGRLLDVPGHEPRPVGSGRAVRVHFQPQLRGPSGQGRPDPPGVATGGRRDRRPGHPVVPVRPVRSSPMRLSSTRTQAWSCRCAEATWTPTRSSRRCTSSGSPGPASRTACSPPGATTRSSC